MTSVTGPSVAIAGASGKLGKYIVQAFTAEKVRPKFADIVLLSRQRDYTVPGTTTRQISKDVDTIINALEGVEVVINALGKDAHETKVSLIHAIGKVSSVKLYFPSEFGVDHNLPGPDGKLGTHPDFEHREWKGKKALRELAEKTFADSGREVKICHMYTSLMTELSFGPWFGMSVKNKRFEAVGSADQKVSWTCMLDIGKALVSLAAMSRSVDIPTDIRISGDSKSVKEVAQILDEVAGDGERTTVEEVDLEAKRRYAHDHEPELNPAAFIILSMGSGNLDFGPSGLGNNNDLVNPGERLWKWKSVREYAIEMKGRPYAEF